MIAWTSIARGRRLPSPCTYLFTLSRAFVAVLALAAVPLLNFSSATLQTLDIVIVYAVAAMALNFGYGFAGQLALAQPVLLGVGAYTAGIISTRYDVGFWATAVPAMIIAAVTSVLIGLPSLRVRGWYFAVLTFLGVLVFPDAISAASQLTGGDNGISGIKPIEIGGELLSQWQVYELFLAIGLITWFGFWALIRSTWGTILETMRDHPAAAESFGVNLRVTKARVYIVLAIPCGLVGAAYAHSFQYVSPDVFNFNMLLLLIGAVFIGGKGTLWGPVLGVGLFEGISQEIGPFSQYNSLFLGIGVFLAAVVFRGGILPMLVGMRMRLRSAVVVTPEPGPAVSVEGSSQARAGLGEPDVPVAPALAVADLEKAFGGNVVLRGVDLEVPAGKVIGLVGPNGSGKTTLLNVVSGFVHPDRGRVAIGHREATGARPPTLAKLGVSRTFQVPKLVSSLSVRRNLELAWVGPRKQGVLRALVEGTARSNAQRERIAKVDWAARLVGLDETALALPAAALPLGHKRLAEVGRAAVASAGLVCLDEPAAGLSADEQAQLGRAIRSVADSGSGVLLVEHNPQFVIEVCDEIVLLDDGRVAGRGATSSRAELGQAVTDFLEHYSLGDESPRAESRGSLTSAVPRQHGIPPSNDARALLEIEHLNSWYGEAQVLFDIEMIVERSEVVGVLGHNGAGKSTLLRTIAGLHRQSKGSVTFAGLRLDQLAPHAVAICGVSLVREGARVFEPMTVEEHLLLGRGLARRAKRRVPELEEIYGRFPMLKDRRRTRGGYLSGGQRQALALASAFAAGPSCLLLDEPSTGLSPAVSDQIHQSIAELSDGGVALVVAEQDPGWLEQVAQRSYILETGRMAAHDRQGRSVPAPLTGSTAPGDGGISAHRRRE